MLLKGKTAFITGTNRGLGLKIVEEFAKEGADIIAHCRSCDDTFLNKMNDFSAKYKVNISPVFFDLSNPQEIKSELKKIKTNYKNIDILVNNASILENSLFIMSPETKLRDLFEVNFFSVFVITQMLVKQMIKNKKGSIINISSTTALDPSPGKSIYGATKGALISFTRNIASELGNYNIRANCVAPYIIDTDMIRDIDKNQIEKTMSQISLSRMATTEEITNAIVFLASDKASYVNGQVIRIDGCRL